MKKLLSSVCMLTMAFSLAACGAQGETQTSAPSSELSTSQTSAAPESEPAENTQQPSETESSEAAETAEPEDTGTTVLVAYFSVTGNTKALAEYAADALKADLYEIVPAEPYTDADLDYGDPQSRTSLEMDDPNARPEISGSVENMEQYDIVFLGYPIWWGEAPRIISTFMESYDFDGKTIVPFCTSGGSGIGASAENLHELTDGNVTWLDGERLNTGSSRDDMVSWINGLGLEVTAR